MILVGDNNETRLTGNGLKEYCQKKKILQLLYSHQKLSGPVIGKRIGVSLPTALTVLNELTECGFVEIKGTGKSSGGRKPTLYGLSYGEYIFGAAKRHHNSIIVNWNWGWVWA